MRGLCHRCWATNMVLTLSKNIPYCEECFEKKELPEVQ